MDHNLGSTYGQKPFSIDDVHDSRTGSKYRNKLNKHFYKEKPKMKAC